MRAAAQLNISQPAVTAQIQRLEEELGVQLLDRNRRSVRLTEAGETFLAGARATLARAEEAVKAAQRVARGEAGRIRVGFPPSALNQIMPAIMIEFHKQHPQVRVDLLASHTSLTVAALQRNAIDIGYVRLPVEARGVRITPMHREPFVVCLPEGHRLEGREKVEIAELRDEKFILYERKWAPGFHDAIGDLCQRAGFTPLVAQEIDEMYVAATLVATGVGVAILPSMVLSSAQGVVVKQIAGSPVFSEIGVATRANDASLLVKSMVSISQVVGEQRSIHLAA